MPANGLNGVRDNTVQVEDLADYTFGRTDTYAAVSAVPLSGTILKLPTNPQEGDRYEFQCTDGSCSNTNQIFLETQDSTTIQGRGSVAFDTGYAWGVATYQGGTAAPGSWMLYSSSPGASASANRAYTNANSYPPTAPTAGASLIIAAILLTVEESGIFEAGFTVSANGFTAADTVDFTVAVQTVASGMTLANATKAGPPGTTARGAFTSSAAAGIVVSGGAAAVPLADSGVRIIDATDVGINYSWSGIIQNSNSDLVETPFPAGNQVLLTLSMNRSAHTNTFSGLSGYLSEKAV